MASTSISTFANSSYVHIFKLVKLKIETSFADGGSPTLVSIFNLTNLNICT
jgi:hypothetical protein